MVVGLSYMLDLVCRVVGRLSLWCFRGRGPREKFVLALGYDCAARSEWVRASEIGL